MAEFQNIVIGSAAIPALAITLALMVTIPVAVLISWWRAHKPQLNISWLIAGAVGFILSARVLELGVHYVCLLADNPVSRFLNGSTSAYVLYGILMAGVFEECGRYVIMKHIMKKNRTPENAVLYGVGHGGVEVLTVLVPTIALYLVIAVLFSRGNPEAAFATLNITEEVAPVALPSVQAAAAFGYGTMALYVIERVFAVTIHIALTVIVFYGIVNGKGSCLLMAILLHALMDLFPALYQRSAMPLWSVEVWAALWTAVAAVIAVKLYHRMKASQTPAKA